jgi:hypothetical protein
MRRLPNDLAHQFDVLLDQQRLDGRDKATYLKWLRFYWDFCHQCYYDTYRTESLPPFLDKLREQQQSDSQRNQARQAIAWFHYLPSISIVTSDVLAPSENLAAVSRNQDTALKSVVLSSTATVASAATLAPCSPRLPPRDRKRPSQPHSYNQ